MLQDPKCWVCGVFVMPKPTIYGPLRCSNCEIEKAKTMTMTNWHNEFQLELDAEEEAVSDEYVQAALALFRATMEKTPSPQRRCGGDCQCQCQK